MTVPVIRCHGLTKSFRAHAVLRGVSLDVQTGETLVLLGGSGSGKSVLLKHLNGLLRPDAGSVEVDGMRLETLDEDGLVPVRRRVSMLFQQGALFDSLTVGDNVGTGNGDLLQLLAPEQIGDGQTVTVHSTGQVFATSTQASSLTNEVQQLQAELSASGQPEPTSAATQKAVPVILVLRDGRQIEAQGYALVGSTLWILDPQNAMKISISDVDVDATRNENLKRGINVVIPTSP
jgi:ABC-type Fe3+/spermidine/putrescine transport system ATPase subunit